MNGSTLSRGFFAWPLAACVFVAACDTDVTIPPPPVDASPEASAEAGKDAAVDAVSDASDASIEDASTAPDASDGSERLDAVATPDGSTDGAIPEDAASDAAGGDASGD